MVFSRYFLVLLVLVSLLQMCVEYNACTFTCIDIFLSIVNQNTSLICEGVLSHHCAGYDNTRVNISFSLLIFVVTNSLFTTRQSKSPTVSQCLIYAMIIHVDIGGKFANNLCLSTLVFLDHIQCELSCLLVDV